MKNKGWGRTVLSVYNYLGTVTNAIDKVVKARALNSFYYNSTSYGYNDIYSISEHIISLTERKINLINLKLVCEKILGKMKNEHARLLISAFIDKRRAVDTAKYLNISLRSYFRKMKIALETFNIELNKLGYTDSYLYKTFRDECWIMDVKEKFDEEDNFVLETISIQKVYNDYNFTHQVHSNLIF